MPLPDTAAAAKGGRISAATARRDNRGRFVRSKQAPRRADPRLEARSLDHFGARAAPPQVEALRPLPRISGSRSRLNAAVSHLEQLAADNKIKIVKGDPAAGWEDEVARYDQGARTVTIDPAVNKDPALRAWALAHELAHALDPQFEAFGDTDYDTRSGRRADYELVAEAAAKRAIVSFGLVVDEADGYLDRVNPRWERRLDGPLWDRWQSASLPLLRPAPKGSKLDRTRNRTQRRAGRRAGRVVRRRQRWRDPSRGRGFVMKAFFRAFSPRRGRR